MNTREFSYLIVTAEEKNISRAAKRLHLSQPTLTRHIRGLEEEYGVLLFARTASGVELTPAGEVFLKHVHLIRDQLEQAREAALRTVKETAEKLDIGVFGSGMFTIVPRVLSLFSAANPDVQMSLLNMPKAFQIEALHQGRIQVAFDRFFKAEPGLQIELVCEEPLLLAIPVQHPLAGRDAVHLEELRNLPMIGGHDWAGVPENFREAFAACGFEPRVVQKASDVMTSVAMVGCGYGMTFAPASLQSLPIPNVVYRPLLADRKLTWNLECAYRVSQNPPVLQRLLNTVRSFRSSFCQEHQPAEPSLFSI